MVTRFASLEETISVPLPAKQAQGTSTEYTQSGGEGI